jgi:hypothetical protein
VKLIIRDYLASLKEREELDAILPDLLSELGFTVFSKPRRGTVQYGVDIAAVGTDDDGERKVFLFSVKQGDLTRQDWDGTSQSLRSSLNAIRDVYIRSRIPKRYGAMKVVVCLCFGGDIQEQVRDFVRGYIDDNTTDRISFDEWNGDKIAGLLLRGILREEILPKPLRSSFQKAVAMVDEPEIAYQHFADLVRQLRMSPEEPARVRVRAGRQIYICLWILFVWARDVGNVDGPYRASELALLNVWHLLRPFVGKRTNDAKAIVRVLHQLIELHLLIAGELLDKKIVPHVDKRHAISMAVESRSSVDINLKMFDVLGRLAMTGLWAHWSATLNGKGVAPDIQAKIAEWVNHGLKLIRNNPTLLCPIMDQQAIEIAIFLVFATVAADTAPATSSWLREMVSRLDLATRTHGGYPCVFTAYRDLVDHPRDRSDAYRKEATSGSILIPLLAAWLSAFGDEAAVGKLADLKRDVLEHCTLQLWLPDQATEDELYIGGRDHGVALTDLPLPRNGKEILETVAEACRKENSFAGLSAMQTGYWPLVLLACRHFRLPVPPQFWIDLLRPSDAVVPEIIP